MLTASEAYKGAILPGAGSRRTAARVSILATAMAVSIASCTSADVAAIADLTQVTNEVTDPAYRIASCEPDFWSLDGSTVFAPAASIEVGYVSDSICDANGDFAVPPQLVITTSLDFSGQGLTLFFDRLSGDYPVAFDIVMTYGASTIYSKIVTDNDTTYLVIDEAINPDALNVDTVTITFRKMNKGYRRARLSEFFFGIMQQYGPQADQDMLRLDSVDETDITGLSLPYGETSITVNNRSSAFNLITPTGIAKYLQVPGAEVKTELGVYVNDSVVEYVKTRTDLFQAWKAASGQTVQLKAADAIGYYGTMRAISGLRWGRETFSPYYYIGAILIASGVPSAYYDISNIPDTTLGFMVSRPQETLREELRSIAQWLCQLCVVDSAGVIRFVDASTTPDSELALADCSENPGIDSRTAIGGVDVNVYSITSAVDYTDITSYSEPISGIKQVKLYVGFEYTGVTITLGGGVIDYSYAPFSDGYYLFTIEGDGTTVNISVTGQKTTVATSQYAIDNPLAIDPTANRVKIDNRHICTQDKAAEVAAWTLANANRLLKIKSSYRGNPLLEPADMVTVETPYGDQDMLVTKSSLTFNGSLKGTLEGVAG